MKEVAQTIGQRLREERYRLTLTQKQMAGLAGIAMQSQHLYENDHRNPMSDYMAAIAELGVDVRYVLTGRRVPNDTLNPAEDELLTLYRQCNADGQTAVTNVLRLISSLTKGNTP